MNIKKVSVGFIGAGGIAISHAYALNTLKYFYTDVPRITCFAVSSFSEISRSRFAGLYGFRKALTPDDFFADDNIDTVFILSPNNFHYKHLEKALRMPSVRRIYIEKPLCSNHSEERRIEVLNTGNTGIKIQVGFQYLFMPAVREAIILWKSGIFGKPVHFDLKYYHGDYLQKSYRDKRRGRLTHAPEGGAMADLGSHVISIVAAFLGNDLALVHAINAGGFPDVDRRSDLFSQITIYDRASGAAGTVSASRISSGSGDTLSFEFFADGGSVRFSTSNPDSFEYYTEQSGVWTRVSSGSMYKGITSFPSGHVPSGWLRSLVHAHYVFLTEKDDSAFIPGIEHGLTVQRLVRETADFLQNNKVEKSLI